MPGSAPGTRTGRAASCFRIVTVITGAGHRTSKEMRASVSKRSRPRSGSAATAAAMAENGREDVTDPAELPGRRPDCLAPLWPNGLPPPPPKPPKIPPPESYCFRFSSSPRMSWSPGSP